MDDSDAIPCWVDRGVESIKEEDAIGSDRVQKPCFDLELDIYPNLPPDEYDLVAHIELDLMYTWEGLWYRNCHLVPW